MTPGINYAVQRREIEFFATLEKVKLEFLRPLSPRVRYPLAPIQHPAASSFLPLFMSPEKSLRMSSTAFYD